MVKFSTLDLVDIVDNSVNRSVQRLEDKMVKKNSSMKQKKKVPVSRSPKKTVKKVFGPVATVESAPVSIGNSIHGATPVVVPTADGVRVKGRDFLFGLDATSTSVTTWTLVGGCPVCPLAMVASAVKGFANSYASYKIHGVSFHYITAATTGDAGSVALYINKDRNGPGLPTNNSNFLPLVLSDHNSVLSPVWTNCSALFFPSSRWYATDLINGEPLPDQCAGEVLVYSRITENVVPGYVLMDYDISFRELSSNPKTLSFPIVRMKYTQVTLTLAGVTLNDVATADMTSGPLLDGVTTSVAPTGIAIGDVYKVILNIDDSTFTTGSATTLLKLRYNQNAVDVNFTLTDGMTLFAVATSVTRVTLYPNYADALGNGWNTCIIQATTTGPIFLKSYMSLVGSVFGTLTQSNF